MCTPPSNESIHDPIPLAQEEENEVNHYPFRIFDDTLLCDLEGEEVREPLEKLNPSCYDKANDMVDNIDEFIHIGKCK
jgi:hypothetical protein